jgi:hypothetical protein
MKITIKGRYFSDEKRRLMVDFAEWCGKKLLSPQMRRNMSVTIHIVGPKMFNKERLYGTTDVNDDDDWDRPRNFVIKMTSRFEILRSLMILSHEMVHVKQHAKKELAFCGKTGKTKWHGKKIADGDLDYWDLPWEIEAHGREKGLVYQWATERGYSSESWLKEVF